MRIPDSKIDDVRNASDIVDVVSAFVNLKKRGKNYVGLCPFHQEKTPSFSVSQDRQMYYCFGCGKGGNVFTFVMEHEKVSFVEAVRTLAEKAGIALPAEEVEDRAQATENEALYAICRSAGLHYYENLTTTVEGKLALEYFHHRGFSDETIRRFGLGYSMNVWDGLVRFAEKERIDLGLVDKAGLVLRRDDGSGYYDRFRGRAMFPIFSSSGRVLGFGARKMREDDPLGKYINSPETPIYNKSRVLYGLYQSKDAIREKEYAILVEGYADLISVFQAGIQNVVASSGTALTEEQIHLIGRYAKNITLVYDADSAGSKATIRGVDLVIENGLDVKVAELPPGEDPDSFVKQHGGEAFQKLLDLAVSFLDFKARYFQAQGMLSTPEGKTRAVRSIVETIARMKDEIKRNFYIKSVAETYDIYESVLFRELERILGKERTRESYARERESGVPGAGPGPSSHSLAPDAAVPAAERDLVKVMLDHGDEIASAVFAHVDVDAFTHPLARDVASLIHRHLGTVWDATDLTNAAERTDLKSFIANLVFTKYELSKGWDDFRSRPEVPDPWSIADQCLVRLRVQEIDQQLAAAYREMRESQSRGEPVTTSHQRIVTLQQERKEAQQRRLLVKPGNA